VINLIKSIDFASIVGAISALVALMTTLILAMNTVYRNRESRYENETHRAVLSAIRESYEAQISKLTKEMTATGDRWRDANHLLLSAQKTAEQDKTLGTVPKSNFLISRNLKPEDYEVDPKLIMVLTPFSEGEMEAFEIIKETCTRNGFRCVRGDEDYTASDILSHVVRLIAKSRIVIANISSRNPNVFYELGIAHAMDKQTILVSKKMEGVPFDVSSFRVLLWETKEDLRINLTETLLRTIAENRAGAFT
jgi:hypothetical protein